MASSKGSCGFKQGTEKSIQQGVIEQVTPDNGRQESYWLLGSILIILAIASVVLQLNQAAAPTAQKHLSLNVEGKAVLTALSNAADEILFMSEGESLLSVDELIEQGIPPFADGSGTFSAYRWQQPQPDCYFGRSNQSGAQEFVLTINADHSAIYWREATESTPTCSQLSEWQTASHHD